MSIDSTPCGQADSLLKLPRRSGPPLAPGKTSAPGSALTNTFIWPRRSRGAARFAQTGQRRQLKDSPSTQA
jgi:hypothetical protein